MDNNFNYNTSDKSNKLLPIIIAIILIAIVGAGIFLLMKGTDGKKTDIKEASSFFLQNSEKKVALFNKDGNKLTDFIFTSAGSFLNGSALVRKDNESGLINENGKMLVDFGKYKYFLSYAGLYKVTDAENNYFLIDGTGKVITDVKDKKITSFIGINHFVLLEDEKNNTYSIINYQGKEVIKFPISSSSEDIPAVNLEDGYFSVFYNNKNYIFDVETDKEVVSFDTDVHHCVSDVSEDGNTIILNACSAWYTKLNKKSVKVFRNNKTIDLTDKCDNVFYESEVLLCSKNYKKNLLDKDLNLGVEYSKANVKDINTYALENSSSTSGVEFYQNGNLSKKVDCRHLPNKGRVNMTGTYLLRTDYNSNCAASPGLYEYYKANGEKAFDKTYVMAQQFDENGLAKVSDDKINYYLIDEAGKKIGQDYEVLFPQLNYYVVTKNKLKGVMDKDGKELLKPEYSTISVSLNKFVNKTHARITTTDSKYILYNLTDNKEIIKSDYQIKEYVNYFLIQTDEVKQYYTYNGKLIYEEK